MKKRNRVVLCFSAVAAALAVFCLLYEIPVPRTSGPLASEAYVWQQAWNSHVCNAVRASDEIASRSRRYSKSR
ncbi:MAG: hypothetical protein ACYS8W_10975 [Planctomycetota bacterium]